MKKRSYFSFAIGRVITGLIIGAALFSSFKIFLRNTYNAAVEDGFDDIFRKYKDMVTKYDAGELGVTFIDILSNIYSSDYIRLARINEDGSFETFFETDYDVVPVYRTIRDWVYLTDDEDLLAMGKRTETIKDADWTIYYKTSEEKDRINYMDASHDRYFDNSWNAASFYSTSFYDSQSVFRFSVDASGTLQYRIPCIVSSYEDGDSFHIGKVNVYDVYNNKVHSGQSWDFTDPSKTYLYNSNVYNETQPDDGMYSIYFRPARPDAFLKQNGDLFLAENMSALEKSVADSDSRIKDQAGEVIGIRTTMSVNGNYTIGRIAVIEINGQKYLVESVFTILGYKDFFKKLLLISGCVILILSAGIACLVAIRPYSQYKKAYENNRFKNNLIDSLAHNLKTPLQVLGGFAENLKDVSDGKEKDRYADQILAKTAEMNADIEAILKTAGKTVLVLSRTSARQIFEEAASKAGAAVNITGDREIRADKDYFMTAAFNLIDNANKYKTADSDIDVVITPKAVTVRNRTDRDKFTPGTGISIAGRIIEQHKLRLKTYLKDGVFEAKISRK